MPDLSKPIDRLDAAHLDIRLEPLEFEAEGDVQFELDDSVFSADTLYYSDLAGEWRAQRNVSFLQDRFELWAEDFEYTLPAETPDDVEDEAPDRLQRGRLTLSDVHIYEPGRELHAEQLTYDLDQQTGEAEEVRGRAEVFYFGASKFRVLGPAEAEGEDLWITTCNQDPPHYRIRLSEVTLQEDEHIEGTGGRLEVLGISPPIVWPRWRHHYGEAAHLNIDFSSGRAATIGYYANIAQRYPVAPNIDLGYRLFPTAKEGVGFGVEGEYDFMDTPTPLLQRSEGEFHSLYTTQDRWYYDATHRQEIGEDTVLLLHSEQWSDRDFFKDFFYEEFRNRSEPRTYANITHTHPDFIATATLRRAPHGFIAETQRMPEGTFHLLERRLNEIAYVTYDVIVGYNERRPARDDAFRLVNVGRLTGDFDVHKAFKLTPFIELEAAYYSKEFRGDRDAARFSALMGATAQSRFQRAFPGALGFSQFRHIVQPSLTYSYRPRPTVSVDRAPRFDFYDNVYGRSRIEGKLDNVVLGQDAETGEIWQVGRLSLFHGDDIWNELRRSTDYEAELDIRPRPWWGMLTAIEYHSISDEMDLDEPFIPQRTFLELYETIVGQPFDREQAFRFNAQYGSYRRWMSYLYYDDRPLGGDFYARAGVAYTKTQNRVFNREILYGLGHKLGDKWTFDFEHRYDFERNTLTRQEYALRRDFHCWEVGVNFRDRERGWDVRLEVNLVDFPGTRFTF